MSWQQMSRIEYLTEFKKCTCTKNYYPNLIFLIRDNYNTKACSVHSSKQVSTSNRSRQQLQVSWINYEVCGVLLFYDVVKI